MRSINLTKTWARAARVAAGACTLLLAAGCMKLDNVPNYDNESLDALQNDPTPARIAIGAQGLMASIRVNMAGGFSYLSLVNWRGREGFNLDPATPGLVLENLVGPLGPESANFWNEGYRAIKLADVVLAALDQVIGLTNAEKEATRGFVKTLEAHAYHQIIIVHDNAGAVLDVGVDPTGSAAAAVAGRAAVYAKVTDLLDQAKTHLTAAGTTAFPFKLSTGFTGFTTPQTFLRFNRALRARVDVHRSTLLGEPRWTEALNALTESFLVVDAAQLNLGVFHAFSTGSGDVSNTSYDPTGRALLGHPSIETKAQLRADLTKDLRFQNKVSLRLVNGVRTKVAQSGVSSDLIVKIFTSNNSPLAIIRNEDLILLRAEARLATGDRVGALADINFIRVNSGGLTAIADPGDPGLMNELIYNRRYSLFWEGWRWVDMRRWNRFAELEQDLGTHRIFRWSPLPLAECTARSPQPPGCAPEPGVTGVPYP